MNSEPDNSEWHIWVIKPGKFNLVKDFIEKKVPEVKKILRPEDNSEKHTPLYSGYVFLNYVPSANLWHRINNYIFISRYIGKCSAKELLIVKNAEIIEKVKKDLEAGFNVGDKVCVKTGFLKDRLGVIAALKDRKIDAEIQVDRQLVKATFSPADLQKIK